MPQTRSQPEPVADGAVVTKAAMRAAARLGLSNRSLARILGVSEATVSRMGAGTYLLKTERQGVRARADVPAAVPLAGRACPEATSRRRARGCATRTWRSGACRRR